MKLVRLEISGSYVLGDCGDVWFAGTKDYMHGKES